MPRLADSASLVLQRLRASSPEPTPLETRFPEIPAEDLVFLKQSLIWSPTSRPSAGALLEANPEPYPIEPYNHAPQHLGLHAGS